MKNKANITTLDQIFDKKYGEKGAVEREQWEQEFEAFRLGGLLEQASEAQTWYDTGRSCRKVRNK